jgi:uncharacterized protein with PQ loop repeat
MNIRNIKSKLFATLIGVVIFSLWLVYAILTNFDFTAFFFSPTTISIILVLSVPIAFIIADLAWGDK